MTLLRRLLVAFLPLAIIPPVTIGVLQWIATDEMREHDASLLDQARENRVELEDELERMQAEQREDLRASERSLVAEIAAGVDTRIHVFESVGRIVVRSPLMAAFLTARDEDRSLFRPALRDLFEVLCDEAKMLEIALLSPEGEELLRTAGHLVRPGGDPVLDVERVGNASIDESGSPWLHAFLESPRVGLVRTVSRTPDVAHRPWVVDIAIPVRTHSNRLARDNRSVDAVVRVSVLLDQLTFQAHRTAAAKGIDLVIEPRTPEPTGPPQDRIEAFCLDGQVAVGLLSAGSVAHDEVEVSRIAAMANAGIDQVEARTTQALDTLHRHESWLLVVLVITCTGTLLAVVLVARSVARPTARLAHMARTIADGQLDLPVALRGPREIEELGDDFDRMRMRLKEQIAAFERANRDLTVAMEVKSQFLANMSHEIRTPLNGVMGMTELLLDSELDEQQRQFAETAQTSGETLLRVINDILDLSKIEAGKMQIESIPFALRVVVEETAELLSLGAHRKGLELVCVVAPGLPVHVMGDPTRLRQVLANLCGNGIKFTERGQVVVHVRPTEGDRIRFEVVDTGIGIEESDRERLFLPFSQIDASTTRRFGGTGLGLTICRQLVEMMGGGIGVESRRDVGSTFWFEIPLRPDPEAREDAATPAVDPDLRVLVCDDNAAVRQQLSFELLSLGVHVDIARCHDEVLPFLTRARDAGEPYDLLLVDWPIVQHSQEAPEPADWIRRIGSQTALIALVPLGDRGPRAGHDRAVRGVLTKPIKQSDLVARLRGVDVPRRRQPAPVVQPLPTSVRVLVAEDNPVNQTLAVKMLQKLGHTVEVVGDGAEAVRRLRETDYDVVLMDVQMPVMDGLQAARMIRDPDSGVLHPAIPIIALTANAMGGDEQRCLDAGMDTYLAKPLRLAALDESLRVVLGGAPVTPLEI